MNFRSMRILAGMVKAAEQAAALVLVYRGRDPDFTH
jgi:hypothetical protein